MPRENTTIYVILGFLSHESMTGYDMKKRIDSSISYFWDVGYGQIYPTLKAMAEDGLVTSAVEANDRGPERILYSITDSGRSRLSEWLEAGGDKEYVRYEILLKLFFGGVLPAAKNVRKIREFENTSRAKLEIMERYSENLMEVMKDNKDHMYYYLTVLFGKYAYQASVDWAEEAAHLLEAGEAEL